MKLSSAMTESTLDFPESFHFQGRIRVSFQRRAAYSDRELPARPSEFLQVRLQSRYMTRSGRCQMYLGKDESVGRSGDRPRGKNRRTMRAERHFGLHLRKT